MKETLVHSAPVLDELLDEDGAVVLVSRDNGHRVVRVSMLGQAIRELAAEGVTLVALAEGLRERFGDPTGDAASMARTAVEALAAEGLVTLEEPPGD